jgi:hypothetical protein
MRESKLIVKQKPSGTAAAFEMWEWEEDREPATSAQCALGECDSRTFVGSPQ